VNKGHGRLEVRHAVASTELTGYTAWPGVAQVLAVTRHWQGKGVWQQATHYVVTSLPPEVAAVERLPELKRGHWGIENRLHYIKDVTLGEDRSLIHLGYGGAVMAGLRSAAVSVLHQHGIERIAATLRANSQHPGGCIIECVNG
jgi:predicted transposase YbfD/YdcC